MLRQLVCEVCGITVDEINSRSRERHLSKARALFYKLCVDAGIGNKEAVFFLGRSKQSITIYQKMLAGSLSKSEDFADKYARCVLLARQIKKNPPASTHAITTYTKTEELMMLAAIASAKRFMRHYCAESS